MATELAERREPQAVAQAPTPAHMLQTAIERGVDMAQLEKLMDLEERYRASKAKEAFDQAMAAFHEDPPKVLKDKPNKQYGSMYTSLGNLVTTVGEALGKHGLSARWTFGQEGEVVVVTCILSHAMGHSESVTLKAPPDSSGAKNPIQQIKSTTTYLRGATFEAVTGIASHESVGVNRDDDGNGPPSQAAPTADEGLMADLWAKADEGWPALQKTWASLTEQQRTSVGSDFRKLKERAQNAGR